MQEIPNLTRKQREKCLSEFNVSGFLADNFDIPEVIVEAKPDCCPHCKHDSFWKWGHASGLQRWRCKQCSKTFNALTNTPLSRLRKKEKWIDNAKSMIAGESVRKTADNCGVHYNTTFRWRHRFLEWQQRAQCKDLSGIAESDSTFFRYSEKGKKTF